MGSGPVQVSVVISKSKVLFIRTDSGNPDQLYALDHYAMLAGLSDEFRSALLGSLFNHTDVNKLEYLGDYPAIKKGKIVGTVFTRISALIKAYRSYRPDIIHVRAHLGDIFCLILARVFVPKARVILDIRTLSTSSAKKYAYDKMAKWTVHHFDHVFALNQEILQEYGRKITSSSVLMLGYDPVIFAPCKTNESKNQHKSLRFVYYGSLHRQRQLHRLVDAFLNSLKEGRDLYLDIYGKGDAENELNQRVPERFRDRINFLGFIPYTKIGDVLENYDIGLAYVPQTPIFDANLPLKTIEMLACGLPVLATKTKGNRSVVTDNINGWLVEDNTEDLTASINRITDQELANNYDREQIATTVSRFSWSELAEEQLFPIYRKLLDESRLNPQKRRCG